MALSDSLPQINLGVQGETQGGLHSGDQRINPEFRVGSNFRIIPEQYFSGMENVAEFLENIDNNLTYYEIPTQLACAYLKGHLTEWALDWFEVLGCRKQSDRLRALKASVDRTVPRGIGMKNSREMRSNNRHSDNSRPLREFNRFESQGVADNWRFDGRR
ncbi:uncharacterized protein TNCV_528471 [Trichonephila clavipes]|nr:uncharacterized protein TNCV_528471 [Trichonephila clavipes]